ncbi:hypothetical protein BLNAU_16595 [Blattamonas nauphoetae]|uniref:Uncharacterized protein n=1 Tax=Blattamonas nauphoetae TaxID=2049346 RepID=A0ABQ9XDX2_9EUKA|nr:hypothetical protein BLNAU_16595 [Blattamonas nauphoetae]
MTHYFSHLETTPTQLGHTLPSQFTLSPPSTPPSLNDEPIHDETDSFVPPYLLQANSALKAHTKGNKRDRSHQVLTHSAVTNREQKHRSRSRSRKENTKPSIKSLDNSQGRTSSPSHESYRPERKSDSAHFRNKTHEEISHSSTSTRTSPSLLPPSSRKNKIKTNSSHHNPRRDGMPSHVHQSKELPEHPQIEDDHLLKQDLQDTILNQLSQTDQTSSNATELSEMQTKWADLEQKMKQNEADREKERLEERTQREELKLSIRKEEEKRKQIEDEILHKEQEIECMRVEIRSLHTALGAEQLITEINQRERETITQQTQTDEVFISLHPPPQTPTAPVHSSPQTQSEPAKNAAGMELAQLKQNLQYHIRKAERASEEMKKAEQVKAKLMSENVALRDNLKHLQAELRDSKTEWEKQRLSMEHDFQQKTTRLEKERDEERDRRNELEELLQQEEDRTRVLEEENEALHQQLAEMEPHSDYTDSDGQSEDGRDSHDSEHRTDEDDESSLQDDLLSPSSPNTHSSVNPQSGDESVIPDHPQQNFQVSDTVTSAFSPASVMLEGEEPFA